MNVLEWVNEEIVPNENTLLPSVTSLAFCQFTAHTVSHLGKLNAIAIFFYARQLWNRIGMSLLWGRKLRHIKWMDMMS